MKRLLIILGIVLALVLATSLPALARHGGTSGAGQECNGIPVAEAATGYDTGYCE